MTRHITPKRFDALAGGLHDSGQTPRIIWTLPAIGERLGRGRDFAQTLAAMPASPIRREGRRYYAFEDELIAYMRRSGLKRPSSQR